MEDPWANAWGDASDSKSAQSQSISVAASSPWSAPSVSVIHGDHEDDLSSATWSSLPVKEWDDPSLWGSNDDSTAWNPTPSTFDKISLGNDSLTRPDNHLQSPESPSSSFLDDITSASPQVETPENIVRPIPPPLTFEAQDDLDSDAFGTFETATTVDADKFSPSKPNFSLPSADVAVWDESWKEPTSPVVEQKDELEEAWESAKQQKEKQDRYVPPELMSSIFQQLKELSLDLWPNPELTSEDSDKLDLIIDIENLDLNDVKRRLLPDDLTLPLLSSKSFTSKQLLDALRLTRHSIITRSSPMALYMSSKGLTSWEASVKAKPNITSDDFSPPGWKIVESVKSEAIVDESKKKSTGSIFSFFGRKATSELSNTESSSPIGILGLATSSPRASIDSSSNSNQAPPVASTTTSSSQVSVSDTKPSSVPSVSVSSAAPVTQPSEELNLEPTSAVSRFLGRFSARSSKTSLKDSLALSGDDLDFLSEVPAMDTYSGKSEEDVFSAMLQSPSLPALTPPPAHSPRLKSSVAAKVSLVNDFSVVDEPNPPQMKLLSMDPLPPLATSSFNHTVTSSSFSETSPILSSFSKAVEPSKAWEPQAVKPVSSQTKRAFIARMGTSRPPSSTPPLLPKPTPSFVLPPPPSSSSAAKILKTGVSQLPSRSYTPIRPLGETNTLPVLRKDEQDDFTDFLSSPAQSAASGSLSFGDFSRASSSTHSFSPSSNSLLDFEDFAVPQPPAKFTSVLPSSSFTEIQKSSTPNTISRDQHKISFSKSPPRLIDHSKAINLLESASNRRIWPGPPSPEIKALPSPGAFNRSSLPMNILDEDSTMRRQPTQAATLPSHTSSQTNLPNGSDVKWNFPPPKVVQTLAMQAAPIENRSNSSVTGPSGLSAQDLSFFEGL